MPQDVLSHCPPPEVSSKPEEEGEGGGDRQLTVIPVPGVAIIPACTPLLLACFVLTYWRGNMCCVSLCMCVHMCVYFKTCVCS